MQRWVALASGALILVLTFGAGYLLRVLEESESRPVTVSREAFRRLLGAPCDCAFREVDAERVEAVLEGLERVAYMEVRPGQTGSWAPDEALRRSLSEAERRCAFRFWAGSSPYGYGRTLCNGSDVSGYLFFDALDVGLEAASRPSFAIDLFRDEGRVLAHESLEGRLFVLPEDGEPIEVPRR